MPPLLQFTAEARLLRLAPLRRLHALLLALLCHRLPLLLRLAPLRLRLRAPLLLPARLLVDLAPLDALRAARAAQLLRALHAHAHKSTKHASLLK